MRTSFLVPWLLLTVFAANPAAAKEQILDARLHHLRHGPQREWSDFPEEAEGPSLVLRFQAEANAAPCTLRLRQQDVRQTWRVVLNGTELGRLLSDENDTVIYLPVPRGGLRA